MIPVKQITITRAEGPTKLCGKKRTFSGFAEAKSWLWSQSSTFPERGYDKHDFKVEFEDGETYEGRLDCKRLTQCDNDLDVKEHMASLCRWMAGREVHPHCGEEKYKEYLKQYDEVVKVEYGRFLDTYLMK